MSEDSLKAQKISVVTVCRNSAATIQATLKSVAEQTYGNIEHLVIDGCSTDDTLAIVRAWTGHPVQLVSEPDDGIYDAMNKGLAQASGDIVGFLNADDVFADATVLEQVANVFQDRTVETCHADLVYVQRDNLDRVLRYWKSADFQAGAFARGWCPAHPTFYARRSVYERLGYFDRSYKLAADADLMIRLLEQGRVKAVYVPRIWVKMRLGGQTNLSMGNIIRQNREIITSLRRHNIPVSVPRFIVSKLLNRIVQRWSRTHVG
jgi:glycosyltransferase involved in cell wall biosynthesis